jgi:methylenetetrahydrofolate reductase (NADPH)
MTKVIDAIKETIAAQRTFFALEYFVPLTPAGTENLYAIMERMCNCGPLFCGITWGDRGSTADSSISIAGTGQTFLSLNMQVNITGYTSTPEEIRSWLSELKNRGGVRNLCVLRGNATGTAKDGLVHFPHAADLIRFIRAEFGDYFGIAVAGFPEGHEDCPDHLQSLDYLKEKVNAGADLIITHMIFDANVFIQYCRDCRAHGILCPIIPGIMPIHSYAQFRKITRTSYPAGTKEIEERLQPVRNDDAEVSRVGVDIVKQLVKALFRNGIRGVYFFTMNMEPAVLQLLGALDLVDIRRELPWKKSADAERRKQESSRPIHWASCVVSYLMKTSGRAEAFPNGRFSDTTSAAYGEDTHYHTNMLLRSRAKRCPKFFTVESVADVCGIFLEFLNGDGILPWADDLSAEAQLLMEGVLKPLNSRGLFTINSQPAVNCVPSTNQAVGWGPPGGYVYQKMYLEFFCPPEHQSIVCSTFDKYPTLTYMLVDSTGKLLHTNLKLEEDHDNNVDEGVTAVTWGVFPNRKILQPTVVSTESFRNWAPEAFGMWEVPYATVLGSSGGGGHSQSASSGDMPPVIAAIRHQWVLINVFDNDFTAPPLERAVHELCTKFPPLTAVPPSSPPQFGSTPPGHAGEPNTPAGGEGGASSTGSPSSLVYRKFSMDDLQVIASSTRHSYTASTA